MDRDRLTITMRKDILRKVDQIIDGTSIRNRSHAIETLITRAIAPKIDTAVILAGGKGIKLRPLTYEIPKSLIPVSGKPLVEYTIDLLRKAEVRNIIFVIGHLGDKIKDYFGDGRKFGVRISYISERKSLGTAGALRNVASIIHGSFVVIHGDVLTRINLLDLLNFHSQQNVTATVSLTTDSETETHGNVSLQGTKIIEFQEKPKKGSNLSLLINAGIYVFEPSIFSFIAKSGVSFFEKDIFPRLAKEEQLAGFSFSEAWFDITTPKSYERALKFWKG